MWPLVTAGLGQPPLRPANRKSWMAINRAHLALTGQVQGEGEAWEEERIQGALGMSGVGNVLFAKA